MKTSYQIAIALYEQGLDDQVNIPQPEAQDRDADRQGNGQEQEVSEQFER